MADAEGQHTDDAAPIPVSPSLAYLHGLDPKGVARLLRHATDELVRTPLWDIRPEFRKAFLHERRRRFGIYDDDTE
jgi:hypothetical protein